MMKKNDRYFIVSLFSLAVSLFLLPLLLYLLPGVWLGWNYHTPEFIINGNDWLQDNLGLSEQGASWWELGVLFLSSLVFSGLAYWSSTQFHEDIKPMVNSLLTDDDERVKPLKQDRRELFFLVIKIVLIMMLVYLVANMMQWAIAVSPVT